MNSEKSRKHFKPTGLPRPKRTPLAAVKTCPCCGRQIVLLRTLGRDGQPGWRWCYLKGWDGDIYWTHLSATPHPFRRFDPSTGRRERIWAKPKVDESLG